ncbi:MAG: zeta toxin family protein [Candidatus Ornithomonoglobus sp.]
MKSPCLMVMAGPNGSGKSTITSKLSVVGEYINADDIQQYLACSSLEAAQIAEATREYMLEHRKDFTFESVMSTPRNYNLMERAKNEGYNVVCIYVLTNNAEINVERVKSRVRNGGHDVPHEKIRERYKRAMKLFPRLFDICDECYVYDNSNERGEGAPAMIVHFQNGKMKLIPNAVWSKEMLEKLCDGTYIGA